MTYFAFVSQYFQNQSINIVVFDMLPLLYDVTGHIMCPVKLCYIIQHLRHVDNEKNQQYLLTDLESIGLQKQNKSSHRK